MDFELIVVRYGEIGLKSDQTRLIFERKLTKNIENVLREFSVKFDKITCEWGRVYVHTTDERAFPLLKMVFGVVSFSPAFACPAEMDAISGLSTKIAKETIIESDTFAVRATRQGTHAFKSKDIGIRVGADIQKATKAGVNLDAPKREVFVEVRNKTAYVFVEKIHGPGGIPQGVEGRVVGIFRHNEPFNAAAYLMAKRGCDIEAVACEHVDTDKLQYWLGNLRMHTIDCKKDIYDEAERVANETDSRAIFTADTLTPETLGKIKDFGKIKKKIATTIFRPLLGFDEKAIAGIERQIQG